MKTSLMLINHFAANFLSIANFYDVTLTSSCVSLMAKFDKDLVMMLTSRFVDHKSRISTNGYLIIEFEYSLLIDNQPEGTTFRIVLT